MTGRNPISLLPPPNVIEGLDYEALLAERKAEAVALWPPSEQPSIAALLARESEPMTKIIEAATARDLVQHARYNDEARSLLLAFAEGPDLDHIGSTYYQTDRLVITPADPDANPPVAEVLEEDEDYRERCWLKPATYSTAGPTAAYEYLARSASGDVKDAKATSPTGGTTVVYVLSRTGNGTASPELLATVEAALSGETVRPLSEVVIADSAEVAEYALVVNLYVYDLNGSELLKLAAEQGLDKYTKSHHRLGHDITQTGVNGAAWSEGVQRIESNLFADIARDVHQAAYCTSITVNVAGVAT